MTEPSILDKILKELKSAKKKHPQWPVHIVARAAIVGEEAGELTRAALNYKYECRTDEDLQHWLKEMEKEAIHTAATCIRFLENLKKLEPSTEHQKTDATDDNSTEDNSLHGLPADEDQGS